MDGGELFAAFLLVAGFLAGAVTVLAALFLAIQMLWRKWRDKRDKGAELRQEQAMAVAVAEASISQDFNDRYHFYEAMYAEILHNSDTGPMPCV
jgi:membrane protein implicated in regulation of membrane protease activity